MDLFGPHAGRSEAALVWGGLAPAERQQATKGPGCLPRAVCPAAATTQTGFPAAPPALSSGSRNLPAQECAAPGARWSPAHRSLPRRRSSRPRGPEDAPTRPKHRRPRKARSPRATAVAPHGLDSRTKCIEKVTAPARSTGGHPPGWERENKRARRLTNRQGRHNTRSLIVQERWTERPFPKTPRTHGWLGR